MTDNAFAALGLHHTYCDTVAELGFNEPSDIQQQAIPEVLAHKDLLGIAQTGTGKTAAFGLPLLQNLVKDAASEKAKCAPNLDTLAHSYWHRPGNLRCKFTANWNA